MPCSALGARLAVVEAFWAGALAHRGVVDLWQLAEQVGGLDKLSIDGAAQLERAGLCPERARAWRNAEPLQSRGDVITMADAQYPSRLRGLQCAPPVLFVQGDADCLEERTVAVVGTRNCTGYGEAVARNIAGSLARAGVVVISGLARGIDAHAHRAACRNGRTLAVMASGLSFTAPSSNQVLRRKIVETGGLVLTIWPDDVSPQPFLFPQRNQWIAALSDHVVVVEAPQKSGALYTAEFAADFGREVWAVPGPIGSSSSTGCHRIIAQGARVVVDVDQMLQEMTGERLGFRSPWLQRVVCGESLERVAMDENTTVFELLQRLSRLEVQGRVVCLGGQRYALA